MTEELKGIDALRKNINDTWDADSHIIKDKFMEDPDYDLDEEVSQLAHDTSEALSGGGLNTQERADILADYYTRKADIDDPGIIGEFEGDDFRGNVDKIIDAIIYEQAQQIFRANYENDVDDWQEEYDAKLDAEEAEFDKRNNDFEP